MKVAILRSDDKIERVIPSNVLQRYAELKGFKLYFYSWVLESFESSDGADEELLVLNRSVSPYSYHCVSIVDYGDELLDDAEMYSDDTWFSIDKIKRNDVLFIQAVEELGLDVMKIIDIPDGTKFCIFENEDGSEIIEEEHRSWC